MKKSRFTDSQIMAILKQHEAGIPIADLAREHNVCTATIYQWKVSEVSSFAPCTIPTQHEITAINLLI